MRFTGHAVGGGKFCIEEELLWFGVGNVAGKMRRGCGFVLTAERL
jgi:hypothetical protein